MTTTTTRNTTPHDAVVQQRLYNLYTARKDALGLTQTKIAKELGIKQPSVSQYLKGTIALRNEKTLIRFADILHVSPEDIDPDFRKTYRDRRLSHAPRIPCYFQDKSPAPELQQEFFIASANTFGIHPGPRYSPVYTDSAVVLCEPGRPPRAKHLVVLEFANEFRIYRLRRFTQTAIEVITPAEFTLCAKQCVANNLADQNWIHEAFPTTPIKFPLDQVQRFAPITGIFYT